MISYEQERKPQGRWGSGGEPPIPAREELEAMVRRALAEDIGPGDVTTDAIVPAGSAEALSVMEVPVPTSNV